MRVAHVNPGIRGLASYVLNIHNYFRAHDAAVDNLIVSSVKWTKQPIPVFEPKSVLLGQVLPWPYHFREIENRLVEYQPDILHHHHPSGRLDYFIDRLRRKLDVPLVTTVHMSIGSKRYFIDWVMHMNFILPRHNFNRDKERCCYVAISRFVQKQIEDIGGLPRDRVVLLYAGVDPEVYSPIEYYKHDWLDITFCGQVMPEKGIDMLVKAVMELAAERKVKLHIIGNGSLKPLLEARTRGRPEIHWVGFLNNPGAVAEYYARSDIIVMPTRWDEAFSYIPIEAMASGTAVIASRTGGNTEIVQDGVNGYLFEQGNYRDLYQKLKSVDIDRCWEMGRNGRALVLQRHTLTLFGSKYKSLYENMANDPAHLKPID